VVSGIKQALAAILIGSVPMTAWSSAGTSGGAILNIPVGARAIAMGEAYTAQADDVSSLYWNPAGLALLNQSQASFLYNQSLDDLSYQNAAVAVPFEKGALGASLSYLSYGQIDGFDANGDVASDVSAYSGVATLGGAWYGEQWAAGLNVKGVQESLADVKATGIAADLGASYIHPREFLGGTFRAAATLRNLGSGLKLLEQTDPFPRQWRVGLALVQTLNRKLNLSVDYGQIRNESGAYYAGAEYWVLKYLALRTGYAGTDTEGMGMRAGVGLKYKDVSFDYAFSTYGDLGISHRYELSLRFGPVNSRLTPEQRALFRRAKLAMSQGNYGEATSLLDGLLETAPDYQPAKRLVRRSMTGYERQERAEAMPYDGTLKASRRHQAEDNQEVNDLEKLLSASDSNVANKADEKTSRTQETPQ
jgi:hypothetical protein